MFVSCAARLAERKKLDEFFSLLGHKTTNRREKSMSPYACTHPATNGFRSARTSQCSHFSSLLTDDAYATQGTDYSSTSVGMPT